MPHRKPLRVRSADTPHALAIYGGMGTLGYVLLTNSNLGHYITDMVGTTRDDVLMLSLMFSGVVAFIAALYSGKVKDPTRGFIVEFLSLIPFIAVTSILIWAVLERYGFDAAPTLTLLLSFINLGNIGRWLLIIWELCKLHNAKKHAILTTTVLADPKG